MNERGLGHQSGRLIRPPRTNRPLTGLAGSVVLLLGVALAQNTNLSTTVMYTPDHTAPGGLDPRPEVTSVTATNGTMTVQWSGIQGPYQLQSSSTLTPAQWQNVGDQTLTNLTAAIPMQDDFGVIRVQGADPNYIGEVGTCQYCHKSIHASWTNTLHSQALQALVNAHQDKNPSCLPCHTVGYGLANGYHDMATTPNLANVQCENCHGPAGNHVANPLDPSTRPIITISSEICGGCHTGDHNPNYDEWKTSKHAEMVEDVASGFYTSGPSRMLACGPCHSGAVRLALLGQLEDPTTPLPSAQDAATFPQTCVVCHTPHENQQAGETTQLRNPTYSLDNFSYSTASSTSFAAQYNPNIQVCGQCHNLRGGKWTDTSRPPHHSPQYNMLIGQGGYDLGVSKIATHGLETDDQCVTCHVYSYDSTNVTVATPNVRGHSFVPNYLSCVECHGSADGAQAFVEATQARFTDRIAEVVGLLNQWATNKAPAALQKYGQLAWEYNVPGTLSNPTGDPSIVGPKSAEQTNVPPAIMQARFNLYLVNNDGSFGVHNGLYAEYLLNIAKTNVLTLLSAP
jgi:hypothetical protein